MDWKIETLSRTNCTRRLTLDGLCNYHAFNSKSQSIDILLFIFENVRNE